MTITCPQLCGVCPGTGPERGQCIVIKQRIVFEQRNKGGRDGSHRVAAVFKVYLYQMIAASKLTKKHNHAYTAILSKAFFTLQNAKKMCVLKLERQPVYVCVKCDGAPC